MHTITWLSTPAYTEPCVTADTTPEVTSPYTIMYPATGKIQTGEGGGQNTD